MKLKTLIITSALTLSLLTSTAFATGAEDFTDIQDHPQYTHIATAVELGLFSGKSATTFSPDETISQAQFLTVVMRAITGGADAAATGSEWWSGTYYAAVEAGIITTNMFPMSGMENDITREQMAYMLTEALEYMGEDLDDNITSTRIPDYYYVSSAYRSNVLTAYSNGLLVGTDTDGTFNPDGTMSRATACIVLSRLVVAENREDVMTDAEYYAEQAAAQQSITEGVTHEYVAKEGDTVVKADGTTVVLAYGENGILGEGQGVAPDLGLVGYSGNILVSGSKYTTTDSSEVDSFGNSLNGQTYKVNPITGSGHWQMEIEYIAYPTYSGSALYELSEDNNWYWNTIVNSWVSCFNVEKETTITAILEYNGL